MVLFSKSPVARIITERLRKGDEESLAEVATYAAKVARVLRAARRREGQDCAPNGGMPRDAEGSVG